MADLDPESFIRSSFRSVWAIELMLHLKQHPGQAWSIVELVDTLRSSELVVQSGLTSLLAAGLVLQDADGRSRYAPASPEIEHLAAATEVLYAKKPNAVRRMIVVSRSHGVSAFADAFLFRKD